MTRILVIGSSHVGAYKNASKAFVAKRPDITLDFFGVRGPLFLSGKMDKRARFSPPIRSDKDRDFVMATNGALKADTAGADHVLVVGHRFAFPQIATLFEDHDILEGIRTGRPRVLSEAMLREIIESITKEAVDDAAAAFSPCAAPVTFALAPYPASSIVERGSSYALARAMALFWARPDAAWVFELWQDTLRRAVTAHGHQLLDQPDTLNDGPYATKPEFAARPRGLDGDKEGKVDHRHMNADYGLAMLCALADTLDATTPLNERIA